MDDTMDNESSNVPATNSFDEDLTSNGNGNSKKNNRHAFPKINKTALNQGEHFTTHPFLEQSLEAELVFCRTLAVDKPFIAPFGSVSSAWKEFITRLNEHRDKDNNLVFDPPVTERYARERVNEYFTFVKKKIDATPFKSGCDDEEAPCELLQIIEDLYEQKKSYESEATKKKNNAVVHKQEADTLRSAALGNYTPKDQIGNTDVDFILNIDMDQATPAPYVKKKGNISSNSSNSIDFKSVRSNMDDSGASLQVIAKRRMDIKAEKEQNKKLKLEVQLKTLEDKATKRAEKAKQKEFDREQERKSKELEREQSRLMMQTLLSLKKNDDKHN
jgi:hypothetical protein